LSGASSVQRPNLVSGVPLWIADPNVAGGKKINPAAFVVLLHINMRDSSNVLQQQAIGILGVNLIYAAFYEVQIKESFLEGLAQDVVAERIEIDYVDLRGPAFESWDRRALLVHLVRAGLAEAVFFPSKGSTVPPTEVLHKKLQRDDDTQKSGGNCHRPGSGTATQYALFRAARAASSRLTSRKMNP
jgi:hypothetical protein